MKKVNGATIIILCRILCLPMFIGTAVAIKGNFVSDSTSYVGVVVLFSDPHRTQPLGYCSGFLLSPTVMVTANHSLDNAKSVSVCFDKGPISYAIEDNQSMYYDASSIYDGTPIIYPQYIPSLSGNNEFQTSDLGLIILDQPVADITEFPTLPQTGFADTLKTKTDLKIIGYVMQFQTAPRNNGVTNSWIGTVSQNSATAQLLGAHFAGSDKYLKLTANSAQGKGAVTFGDSGGPVIYTANGQDIVLALNAFVSSVNCNGVSYHTRLDTAQVLAWIKSYSP